LEICLKNNIINNIISSFEESCDDCDLIILSVPTDIVIEFLSKIRNTIKPSQIVIDVCSIKSFADKFYDIKNYIPCHPIAGGLPLNYNDIENSINRINTEVFNETTTYITISKFDKISQNTLQNIIQLWKNIGCKIVNCDLSPDQHDEYFCITSHIPHFIAICYIEIMSEKTIITQIDLSSIGFYRNSSKVNNPNMWIPIFINNINNIEKYLQMFIKYLYNTKNNENMNIDVLPTIIANSLSKITNGYDEFFGAGAKSMLSRVDYKINEIDHKIITITKNFSFALFA
jgi:prephenate dehydrogenase